MITGGCALGPARVEQEYERAGALALLTALYVRTEHVFAATTGIAPFMTLMTQVMSHETYHRALRVFVIVDNGSDHRGAKAIRRLGCLPERSIHINPLSTANAALATFKIADQNGGYSRACPRGTDHALGTAAGWGREDHRPWQMPTMPSPVAVWSWRLTITSISSMSG